MTPSIGEVVAKAMGLSKQLPEGIYTIVAAFFGAGIAYFGVWHSLYENRKRERESREKDMRREVFLAAAEAVSQAETYIRQQGNFNMTDTDLRKFVDDYAPKTCKIHIVAHLSTIEKLVAFTEKFVEATRALAVDRAIMMGLKMKRDALTQSCADLKPVQLNQNLGLITTKISANELSNVINELLRRYEEASQQLSEKSLQLTLKAFPLANELVPLEVDLVVAARSDLGIDIKKPNFDPEKYRQTLMAAASRQQTKWQDYIESVKSGKNQQKV